MQKWALPLVGPETGRSENFFSRRLLKNRGWHEFNSYGAQKKGRLLGNPFVALPKSSRRATLHIAIHADGATEVSAKHRDGVMIQSLQHRYVRMPKLVVPAARDQRHLRIG